MAGHAEEVGGFLAQGLEAVIHHWRHAYEQGILLSHKELIYLPLGDRSLPAVIESHLHHPLYAGEVIRLLLMVVPGLDHSGISSGQVHLAEAVEYLIIAAQDLHQPAALIRDYPQILGLYPIDHILTTDPSPIIKRQPLGFRFSLP